MDLALPIDFSPILKGIRLQQYFYLLGFYLDHIFLKS